MQKFLDQFKGIEETTVGYANGFVDNPSYEEVKKQTTGHTETVEVVYDEKVISLESILDKYYMVIDPTSLNKQGEDEGTNYRIGVYTENEEDLEVVKASVGKLAATLDKPCVIETEMLKCFWPAEEYHQKYLEKNPGGYCHIGGCFLNLNQSEE